uniref:Uncharacterized protein n=1 Tax=Chromera velia CCMP2878 TaxID=1169474 RepID=A0A0G4I5T1_9ALVE|eukprot:Cvel_64.t1-p1 / transcript=Cvel_64.t1 / gene=Cvel_64 / organism=Chromera_velia_CCMP2878 / gene_product=hypothetical protein / transcript_product=hypothetical protein / location=Cvel_scaffold6:69426-70037(+) / protein_length=204 / sequence_SO=supercontig / SO=protein_coding / is_pseudo=false
MWSPLFVALFVAFVKGFLLRSPVQRSLFRSTFYSHSAVKDQCEGLEPTIEVRLKERFDSNLQNHTGLCRDWETYKASLPVRETGERWLRLYTLPYWGVEDDQEDDLLRLAKQLELKGDDRKLVKSICSPTKTGKTTSVLPAFLESNFTHYLYLAFDNNGRRRFEVSPYTPCHDIKVAKKQGAAFAVECVRILLEKLDKQGPHEV